MDKWDDFVLWHMGADYCRGCGRLLGIASVVIDPDDDYSDIPPLPETWPHPVEGCPVCAERDQWVDGQENPPWPKGKPRDLP